jgi:hypothetical protein
MDSRTQAILTELRGQLGLRDTPLVVAASHSGRVMVQGPRRVSARRLAAACLEHGKAFSIVYSAPTGAVPAIMIGDNSAWQAPVAPDPSSTNEATVVLWAAKAGLEATVETKTGRAAGSTDVVTVVAAGEVPATAIGNLLALNSVVNIFFEAQSFDVYFAKPTGLLGGLGHIGATTGHSGKFRTRSARAGKARPRLKRKRARAAVAARKAQLG